MNRRSFLQALVALPFLPLAISHNNASAEEIESEANLVWNSPADMSNSTALDRVNTVRLAMYIRKTYANLINELQFEPNNTKTRAFIHSAMAGVMENLRSRNGVYDYVVICDETNNPPSVMVQGKNRTDIAFKRRMTEEFLYLPLGHDA